jgi:hypothetical protein
VKLVQFARLNYRKFDTFYLQFEYKGTKQQKYANNETYLFLKHDIKHVLTAVVKKSLLKAGVKVLK